MTTFRPLWRRIAYLFSRFGIDRCSENAAALTYMSLFALVPLMTVIYTMASAVPAFQGLEENIQAIIENQKILEGSAAIFDDISIIGAQFPGVNKFS